MRRPLACLRRDWLITASYRTSFVVSIGQILLTTASFFFIGQLVDPQGAPVLAPYGGRYFPFVLLGLAFSRYLTASLSGFGAVIRNEQLQGTLEAVLLTPTRPSAIMVGSLLLEWLWTTAEVVLYLGVGAAVFGVDLTRMDVAGAGLLLILLLVSLSGLGALSACGILLFKEFDPIGWGLNGLMKLVSGVYFPVALLPAWLEPLAKVFPLTYGLEGLRQAVLNGRPLRELGGELTVLVAFALVLWPLALGAFSLTIRRLKQTGGLSFR